VPGHLLLKNCVEDEPTRPAIERALKDDSLLWLDLADTSPETIAWLRDVTTIASVFLPLSFLTGFFGQNLGWLVNREGSLTAFLIFGVGTEVLAVACLLLLFRRRGWM
jgi:magnesium transporter